MKTTFVTVTEKTIPSRHFGTYPTEDEYGEYMAVCVSHKYGGFPIGPVLEGTDFEDLLSSFDEVHVRITDTQWLSVYPD